MKIVEPLIAIFAGAFGLVALVYIFYSFAQTSHDMSIAKSDKELCEERGGIYFTQYRGNNPLCLDKKVLK